MAKYLIHFDGSAWPNPGGTGAWGFTIDKDGLLVKALSGVIGTGPHISNNVAEFTALLEALKELKPRLENGDQVEVRGDSALVINVMNGKWKPKSDKLYYDTYILVDAETWLAGLNGVEVTFNWIPREENQRCDDLSKEHNTKH